MRLLNTTTLRLEEFIDDIAPPYAILSHTWEQDEVTFDDITHERPGYKSKAGYAKIAKTCQEAKRYGMTHAWVDTCCIDKSSSAELTQALNSMFHWYREARVCYAFLADLEPKKAGRVEDQLPGCKWFTRGWTLQELIAPTRIYFYDKDWACRGTRQALAVTLSAITRIDLPVLEQWSAGPLALGHIPVARRMAWAAHRTTTRVEDRAYSLLGIFGVNLPLLYGEREGAFIRLQEEIMRQRNDLSVLAWKMPAAAGAVATAGDGASSSSGSPAYSGVLAPSPEAFEHAANVVFCREPEANPEFAMTNKGLRMAIAARADKHEHHLLPIGCAHKGVILEELAVPLVMYKPGIYARASPSDLGLARGKDKQRGLLAARPPPHERYLAKAIPPTLDVAAERNRLRASAFSFDFGEQQRRRKGYPPYFRYESTSRPVMWDEDNMLYYKNFPSVNFTARHLFTAAGEGLGGRFLLLFGLEKDKPWAGLASRWSHGRTFDALLDASFELLEPAVMREVQELEFRRVREGSVYGPDSDGDYVRFRVRVALVTKSVNGFQTHCVSLEVVR